MKLLIYTAMHRRYSISEMWCIGINEFIKHKPDYIDVEAFAVIDNIQSMEICTNNNVDYCFADNDPLGRKWNEGLKYIINNKEFDYLMIMGDDDFISHKAWKHIEMNMFMGENHFGYTNIYFTNGKDACLFDYSPFSEDKDANILVGCGRVLSKECVVSCCPLWENYQNKNLDHKAETKLIENGYPPVKIQSALPVMVDFKTSENIWSYDTIKQHGIKIPMELVDEILYPEVKWYIDNVLKTNVLNK